jgi:hypothetical protein
MNLSDIVFAELYRRHVQRGNRREPTRWAMFSWKARKKVVR